MRLFGIKKSVIALLAIIMILSLTIGSVNAASVKNGSASKNKDPWTLVWSDEFNGSAVDPQKWKFEIGNGQTTVDGVTTGNPGWGNGELEYYTSRPENAKVQDGKLVITPLKEEYEGLQYTSARLKTADLFSKKYGKFEARIKLPTGKGLWPAFWMMPQSSAYGTWAASGEIDIMEGKGSRPNNVSGAIHYGEQWPNNTYTGKEYSFPESGRIDQYHTYGLEWEPGEIRWYVDGQLYQTQNDWFSKSANQPANNAYPAPFDQPFYMILNLAIGGHFDGNPTDETVFGSANTMEVDYVRVYELTGREYRTPVPPSPAKEEYLSGSKLPQPPDNDLVYNADFTEPLTAGDPGMGTPNTAHWAFYQDPGAAGAVSIDSIGGTNYAKVSISNAGGNVYSIQPQAIVSLAKGRSYKLSFDAKTEPDSTRSMTVKLTGGASRGFTAYSQGLTANLTGTMQHYEMMFQMKQDSDIAARIEFNLGQESRTAWIGNVKLVEIDSIPFNHDMLKTPLADGNHVYNGTFDQGETDRLSFWHFLESGKASATPSVDADKRKLELKVKNGGKTAADLLMIQRGIQLINGQDYKLSFDGSASAKRTIGVQLQSADGSRIYASQSIDLSKSTGSQSFAFKMNDATTDNAQLVFLLGGPNSDLIFDNVRLVRTSAYFPPGTNFYPLANGDFASGLTKWTSAIDSGGSISAAVLNGEAIISVANQGSNPWSGMLTQTGLQLQGGLDYVVSFDAKASVPRKIEVTAENASYTRFFDQMYDLTTEYQNFALEFTMPQDQEANLKFFVGLIASTTAVGSSHDVFIDNVVFQVKGAPVAMPPALTPDLTDNKVGQPIDIAFADDAAWRSAVTAVKLNGITLAADQYALTAGVLTLPAALFPTDGNYQIVVEAVGYAETSVSQGILENDGNLVVNGKFSNGTASWLIWTGEGGGATFGADNGAATIDIGSVGGPPWSVQVYQQHIPMTAGKTYELRFKASSTVARPITVEFTGTSGGSRTFNLTPDLTEYSTLFTVNSVADLQLNYLIGNVSASGTSTPATAHTIVLDDVSVKESAAPVVGHALLNGTFDSNTDGWSLYTADGSNAVISSDTGKLMVDFTAYDGWFTWSTQVYQDSLKLEAGTTYTVSFDASSSLAKTISVEVGRGSGGAAHQAAKPVNLTNDTQTFTFEFTVTGETDQNAKLNFLLGSNNVPGENFVPHRIWIDNVTLTEKEA